MSGVSLLATWSDATAIVFDALDARFGVDGVVLEPPVGSRERFAFRRRHLGLRTALGQAAFVAGAVPVLRRRAAARIAELTGEDAPAAPPDGRTVHVATVNSDEAVAALRASSPRVVVVAGTRIIARDVLESVPAVFVNVHAGMTPMYRGVHGGWWALAERDAEHFGVTVHVVDPGVDTGAVLAQRVVRPTARDNFATYPLLQLRAALPDLLTAVEQALDGSIHAVVPDGPSRQWSHPTLGQYLWRRFRHGAR
jgi:folate-dependent phosphoribosylglycinamide formyltransferase PurN